MKKLTALFLAGVLLLSTAYSNVDAASLDGSTQSQISEQTEENQDADSVDTQESLTDETYGEESNSETSESEVSESEVVSTEEQTTESASLELPIAETESQEMSESTEETTDTESVTDTEESVNSEEEITTQTAAMTQNLIVMDAPLIDCVIIDSATVTTPGTEVVSIGLDNAELSLKAVYLQYRSKTSNTIYTTKAEVLKEDMAVFSFDFNRSSETGEYSLYALRFEYSTNTLTTLFSDMGIEAGFGVNQEASFTPDDVALSQEELDTISSAASIDAVSIDSNGSAATVSELSDVIASASMQTGVSKYSAGIDATGAGTIVVVLDPGHGGADTGATRNGAYEKVLTLKIAQYAKAELEQYQGVKVFLTRTGDTYLTLAQRAAYADSVGADLFVSLHVDAYTNSTANGASVYYPNSNYNASAGKTGKNVAAEILTNLVSLGFTNRGILIRNSENGTTYPDGSLADYLGVIRENKLLGIPAILVEHGFLSNDSDYQNYLSSDAKLQKLGVANATGIAQYYGLSKTGTIETPVTLMTPVLEQVTSKNSEKLLISWGAVTGADNYRIYRSTSADGTFKFLKTIKDGKLYYTDGNVKTGKVYYYKVRAIMYDGSETIASEYSTVLGGKTAAQASKVKARSLDSESIYIKWTGSDNVDGYAISRATKKNGTYYLVGTVVDPTTTSYVDSGLKTGKNYYYKISAFVYNNGVKGWSGKSDYAYSHTVDTVAVKYVRSKSGTSTEIKWSKTSGANGYRIYRSTSPDGNYVRIKTISSGSTTSYVDKKVEAGVTYYYKIKARNSVDGSTGYGSYNGVYEVLVPGTPNLVSVTAASGTRLQLLWEGVEGANGYRIYRSTSKRGTYKYIASVAADVLTYVDKAADLNARYYYKVAAKSPSLGTSGSGDLSNIKSSRPIRETAFISAQCSPSGNADLTWERVTNTSGYKIYRSTSRNGTYKLITTITSNATTFYRDKKVAKGETYYYKVTVYRRGDNETMIGVLSDAVRVTTLRSPVVTSVLSENTRTDLSWGKTEGARGYEIYRSTSPNSIGERLTWTKELNYQDIGLSEGTTYFYRVRAFERISSGDYDYSLYSQPVSITTAPSESTETPTEQPTTENYSIMGDTTVTAAQLLAFYKSGYGVYPASVYSQKGAATIEEFIAIVMEEAEAEGVRAEVLFAQVAVETGYLKFGGQVKAEQCNFGGIGATDNGAAGATFASVRIGLRAQVQHLKAYASKEALNQTCVDPRFKYVTRGSAVYVQNLGNGKWATDPLYSIKLMACIGKMKTF
ncbi:MAG: N-acetylmuramoyl-L-alanine amidase [Lachnospiraceae bacterium]